MKNTSFYLALSLVLTGIIFSILAIGEWNKEKIRDVKYERTLGRVLSMKKNENGELYPVIGFYALDSQKVRVHAKKEVGRFASYELGDVVEIYYDVINPDDMQIVRFEWFWISFLSVVGICFVVGGTVWLVLLLIRLRKRQWLIERGTVLEGVIQTVVRDTKITIKGKPAFLILCEWKRDQGANPLIFRSDPFAYDPSALLAGRESLMVYIDLDNPEHYWVDTQFLER